MLLLRFQDLPHCSGLGFGPFGKAGDCILRVFGASRFQVGQQLTDIAWRSRLQLPDHDIRHRSRVLLKESGIEQREGSALGFAPVRRERALADRWICPPSGHRYQFLVQACGTGAIKGQAADKENARNGIGRLRHAGARQIMVDKALGSETRQQPLDDAVLEVKLNDFLRDDAGVLEHDGTDGGAATPIPELLVAGARRAEAVHGFGPGRVRAGTLIESGKNGAVRPFQATEGGLQWFGTKDLEGAGNRGAEVVQRKANRLLRIGEHGTQAVDLLSQIELPLSRGFEFFIDGFSGILIQVGRFDLILDQVNVGAANAGLHDGIKALVDDLG